MVLHGLFGSLGNWGWHCKQLAADYAVYGVDLRNHGASPHADELNYQVMAADVKLLLQQLGITSCYLIGHSMGGKVAMQLALTESQLIDRLIVVDIAPVAYSSKSDGHLSVMAGMKALDLDRLNSRTDAERQLTDYVEDEATRKFVLTNLVRDDAGKYAWRLNLAAIEQQYDRLREPPSGSEAFQKPTLFVKGALSNYIQKKHEAEILDLFPAASVKVIMQAGHWLHAEKPQALLKIVRDFLEKPSLEPEQA